MGLGSAPDTATLHRIALHQARALALRSAEELAAELGRPVPEAGPLWEQTRGPWVSIGRPPPGILEELTPAARALGVPLLPGAFALEAGTARSVLMAGAPVDLRRLADRAGLRTAEALRAAADALENARAGRRARRLGGGPRRIPLGDRTRVLGVLNVTPDSFSDGGRYLEPASALARAAELAAEGADLLDVGAESTRPGAEEVAPEVEWGRLREILPRLARGSELPISVDTRHAEVAERALAAGAELVNDVSGLRDPAMRHLLARTGAPAIVMHMRGTPATMQDMPPYDDVTARVYGGLCDALLGALDAGVQPEQLLVDPGLGFGKSPQENLRLLGRLAELASLGCPIVVGASRKRFLGIALGGAPVDRRVDAGLAAAVLAAEEGADLVRTHDVAPTRAALRLADAVRRGEFLPP